MSEKTASNRFMLTSLKRHAGFYQHLFTSAAGFRELGNWLVEIAEQAQAFRQYDRVREAAQVLTHLPSKECQSIGHYYLGLCEYRNGQYSKANEIFERVVNTSTHYQGRAIISLAAVATAEQDGEAELYYTLESLKASKDLTTTIQAYRGIAIIKAREGYHSEAVKELESLYSLARHAPPHIYFDYLNSYAVELNEVGRNDEARNVINHVLASPYASAYPEWLQTAGDLQQANRSFVAIKASPANAANLLSMPQVEHVESERQRGPAQVINLEQWKKKMAKNEDDTSNDRPPNEELDDRELILRIIELISARERTEPELYDILTSVEQVLDKHKGKH